VIVRRRTCGNLFRPQLARGDDPEVAVDESDLFAVGRERGRSHTMSCDVLEPPVGEVGHRRVGAEALFEVCESLVVFGLGKVAVT
jgi:hypothetical protein